MRVYVVFTSFLSSLVMAQAPMGYGPGPFAPAPMIHPYYSVYAPNAPYYVPGRLSLQGRPMMPVGVGFGGYSGYSTPYYAYPSMLTGNRNPYLNGVPGYGFDN